MTARPSDLLRAAKALIDEPHKWCQGTHRIGGRHSALGALSEAGIDVDRRAIYEATDYLLAAAGVAGFETVAQYNDLPTTTHADVMRLYDEAIRAAEKDEGRGRDR